MSTPDMNTVAVHVDRYRKLVQEREESLAELHLLTEDLRDSFADALADLYVAWCALQTQHAEQYEAARKERDEALARCATLLGDVTVLREALEDIEGTYDDGTPAQIIAENALSALEES